jgi:hypothetical protein
MDFQNTEENIVLITTREDPEESNDYGTKGLRQDFANKVSKLKTISVDSATLKNEWNKTIQLIGHLIESVEEKESWKLGMQLEEVTLAVEINGKGQVSLLGVSGEANGKGAITLKFKRKEEK